MKKINKDIHKVIQSSGSPAGQSDFPQFDPHFPEGLEVFTAYQIPCDDKGVDGGTWLKVLIGDDGDVYVSMQEWRDMDVKGSKPDPFPSLRCRTLQGGGRHPRVRQALLWLAQAIRLDTAE